MSPSSAKFSRRSDIPPFHVMEVSRRAREAEAAGADIIHLEVGQPSTPAPKAVIEAAKAALDTDLLAYTDAVGIFELRSAIAKWYQTSAALDIEPADIVVTTGASGSCLLTFLSLWDTGQRVGVLEPGYPCYRNDLQALGIEVVLIPVGADTNYRPTKAHLDQAGPLDGLILATPSNPTGTILSNADLAMVLQWARERGTSVVVDEIYHGISYGVPTESVLGLVKETVLDQPPVVVLNSFSKYFSMTGWRLGWIVAPSELVPNLERLAQNLTIAPPTLSQIAAIAAFDSIPECEANVARYRENRTIVLGGLKAAGLDKLAPPDGGFYVWCDVSNLLGQEFPDSLSLCDHWLEAIGVAVTPGLDFDLSQGKSFVRFSYAGSPSDMNKAMARLKTWSDDRE